MKQSTSSPVADNATKSKATWAPGPWQTVWPLGGLDITEIRTVNDEQTGHVATLGVSFDRETTAANAHLIAQAPALLEACQWMMRELCEAWDESAQKAIPAEYLAAIAKAKGQA